MGGLDRLKKRKPYKFQFDLTLHYITNLPCNDLIVFITWKRGKKRQGGTKKTLVKDHIAVWEDEISVTGTLFKDLTTSLFKKKLIEFSVWEDGGSTKKRDRLVGELSLNLGDFVNAMGDFSKTQVFSIPLHKNYSVGAGRSPSPISETVSGIESTLQCKMTIKSKLRNNAAASSSSGLRKDFLTDESDLTTATSIEPDSETKSYDEDRSFGDNDDGDANDDELSDKIPSSLDDRISLEHGGGGAAAAATATLKGKSESKNDTSNDGKHHRFNYFKSRSRQKQSKKTDQTTAGASSSLQTNNLSSSAQSQQNPNIKPPEIVIQSPPHQPQTVLSREPPAPEIPRDLEETIRKIKEQEKDLENIRREAFLKNRAEAERVLIDTAIFSEATENKFADQTPVSALLIFQALVEWDYFGMNSIHGQRKEKANQSSEIFRKITRGIEVMIEKHSSNIKSISYWLSNVVFLLNLMLQRFPNFSNSRRIRSFGDGDPQDDGAETCLRLNYTNPKAEKPFEIASSSLPTLLAPGSSNLLAKSGMNYPGDGFSETPMWGFQNDLIIITHKAYLNLLLNIYNELIVILVPSVFELTTPFHKTKSSIKNVLLLMEQYFCTLEKNFVNPFVINQIFSQVFYLVNAFLLNTLLTSPGSTSGASQPRVQSKNNSFGKHPPFCSMGSALQLKMAVSRMEEWVDRHGLMPDVKLQLTPLRQASDVMIMNKNALIEDTVLRDVCPTLTAQQLIILLSKYESDEFDPDEVPVLVIQTLTEKFKLPLSNSTDEFVLDIGFVQQPSFILSEIVNANGVVVAPTSLYAIPGFEFLTKTLSDAAQ